MGMENLGDLIAELKACRAELVRGDGINSRKFEEIDAKFGGLENSLNELFRKHGRPSGGLVDDHADERKGATDLCILKHDLNVPTNDGTGPIYVPSHAEIDDALNANMAMRKLFRHGNLNNLDPTERKSLTSFAFGNNSYILQPQWSQRVLSCLTDPDDVAGLMAQETSSGGSLKFFLDNVRMQDAAWACEASCFANNPQPDLTDGLGELEVKVETLRYILCAGSDLLQDASFNIEGWIFRKAALAFRNTINRAIMMGDGIGKPLGILHPASGIRACDTGERTPAGQFLWQDLFALAFEIPAAWHAGASYFMNQRTAALLLSMSDATGRPLWGQFMDGRPGLQFAGFPIHVVSWMPDLAPGSTPVAFGNWKEAYVVVNRRATTMQTDPFSAGFCTLFKFEARIGGAVACPNAVRLLRIR